MYLIFPRVLQGADERPVAAHRVTTDGHPVWVSGEVGVDQFRELGGEFVQCSSSQVQQHSSKPMLPEEGNVTPHIKRPYVQTEITFFFLLTYRGLKPFRVSTAIQLDTNKYHK